MPRDSNETEDIDKILAEFKGEPVEESNKSKKEDKNPFKDKKNDDSNTYEYSDDKEMDDFEW